MEQPKPYEEINQTIDKLAQKIKLKTDELDEVKTAYELKLAQLTQYLKTFQQLTLNPTQRLVEQQKLQLPQHHNDLGKDEDENHIVEKLINTRIGCRHCQETIWDIKEIDKYDYFLIPKLHIDTNIQVKANNGTNGEEKEAEEEGEDQEQEEIHQMIEGLTIDSNDSNTTAKKGNKKKKKMTCSYCSQEGHKRSECQLRLTKGLS